MAFADVLGPPPAEGDPPPPYAYTYVKFLSRGAYGHTYVVQRTVDGAKLVVKVLSLKQFLMLIKYLQLSQSVLHLDWLFPNCAHVWEMRDHLWKNP